MKKILYFCVVMMCISMMASCNLSSGKMSEEQVQDSLKYLNTEVFRLQNDVADLVSTLNATEQELNGINDQISLKGDDETLLAKRERMKQQLETIKKRIELKNAELAQLQKKYESSLGENKELKKCIDRMKKEIEGHQARIMGLENVISNQNARIGELNEALTSTQEALAATNLANESQREVIDNQDKMLNAGYYVVGSKSQLKSMGLIEGGLFNKKRLTTKGFDTSVFTQVDIREIEEIKLGSKDAKLLSPAPESSYELVKEYDNSLTLRILDPSAFWSLSKFLVVMN